MHDSRGGDAAFVVEVLVEPPRSVRQVGPARSGAVISPSLAHAI